MREYFNHKKKVSSVSEFDSLTTKLHENSGEVCSSGGACFSSESKKVYLYRGVSRARYPLVGYRDSRDLYESEYEMYKNVMRVFPGEFLYDTKIVDRLIRVQHYGIPARLIDVTYDPLVALFFAAGGFETMMEKGKKEKKEKEEDGRVIFFGCEPESIVFSDDRKPCLLADLEQGIDYDDFVQALDVFRKFLTVCKSAENLPDSDFKNSLKELVGDIRKTLNSITTDFLNIYTAICCMELLVCSIWEAFLDEDSAGGLKEEERKLYDLLMKSYSEHVSEYAQKTAGELKSDVDVLRFKSVASFLEGFCNFFFVKLKTSNELIERQQGAFLLHTSAAHTFNLDDFDLRETSGFTIKSIVVDSVSKFKILKELRERGVTFSYLFPGLVNYRK